MPTPDAATALFAYSTDVPKFRAGALAQLGSLIDSSLITDEDIWGALVAGEAEAQRALRIPFAPTVIIPENAPQSEVDALVAAGTRFEQEPAYDYSPSDWSMDIWGFIRLRKYPLIRVDSVKFTYPTPMNDVLTVPTDWLRLDKKYGHLRVVPTGTLMGMGPLSSYLLQAMSSGRLIPNMIHIRYVAGLANAARDFPDLVSLVKRMATLKLVKNAFLPQSGSISADGLSQSSSVDVGKWHDEIDRDLDVLRDAIHGVRMVVC